MWIGCKRRIGAGEEELLFSLESMQDVMTTFRSRIAIAVLIDFVDFWWISFLSKWLIEFVLENPLSSWKTVFDHRGMRHACPYVRKVVIIYYWAANNIDLISKKFHHFCVHWIPWYCILFLMTAAYWKSLWNIAVIDLNFRMSHGKTKTDWTSFTLLSWWYHCEKIAKIVVKTIWSANDWKCLVRRLMSVCLKTKIGRSILVTKRQTCLTLFDVRKMMFDFVR